MIIIIIFSLLNKDLHLEIDKSTTTQKRHVLIPESPVKIKFEGKHKI
jgi:hypothetical protein